MKIIDKNQSVYNLTQEYPELIDVLYDIGFTEIKNPLVRKTVGKHMTLQRGAKMKGISWVAIVNRLKKAGYEINMNSAVASEEKVEQLRTLLQSLHAGEELAVVRERFKQQFHNVDVNEIMAAEKSLMESGVPAREIQKLCDLHSALFQDQKAYTCSATLPEVDEAHPLKYFATEVDAIEQVLAKAIAVLDGDVKDEQNLNSLCAELAQIPIHFSKKGDLIYPLLNVKYGIIGPAKVMWAKDVELRQELHRALRKLKQGDISSLNRELIANLQEMCQKEKAFLLPICAKQLSAEDWVQIYEDIKAYEVCLGVTQKPWNTKNNNQLDIQSDRDSAETKEGNTQIITAAKTESVSDGEERIELDNGSLTKEELIAMLNAIPQEITFVDADDINRYFNESPGFKHFKRPKQALGRDVYSCHPPHAEAIVRQMIAAFKSGERDLFVREVNKGPIHLIVEYRAVRNAAGKYLGVLELVREEEVE